MPEVAVKAPDFTLPDETGAARRLSDLAADRPLLLVFYRGHWCPFCLRQLAELRSRFDEFARLGVGVVAVSVDGPERSLAVREQLQLPFPLLCDLSREVVTAYGLLDEKEKGISYPAAFVLDHDLTVCFRSLDGTKTRVDLDGLFAFLEHGIDTSPPLTSRRASVQPRAREYMRVAGNALRRGIRSPIPEKHHRH